MPSPPSSPLRKHITSSIIKPTAFNSFALLLVLSSLLLIFSISSVTSLFPTIAFHSLRHLRLPARHSPIIVHNVIYIPPTLTSPSTHTSPTSQKVPNLPVSVQTIESNLPKSHGPQSPSSASAKSTHTNNEPHPPPPTKRNATGAQPVQPLSPPITAPPVTPPAPYILILDYWERLSNLMDAMQSVLRLAAHHNFTLVEPHIYESMAKRILSFPSHFHAANMTPQPASTYFNTSSLLSTGHFMSYSKFASSIASVHTPHNNNDSIPTRDEQVVVVRAAIFIEYMDEGAQMHRESDPFVRFCDDEAAEKLGWSRSTRGIQMAPRVHAQRLICLHESAVKGGPSEHFFSSLFNFIHTQVPTPKDAVCVDCLPIVIVNYRKYLFFRFDAVPRIAKPVAPILQPGAKAVGLARDVVEKALETQGKKDGKIVAVHLRTGKTFSVMALSKHYKNEKVEVEEIYRKWLLECVETVSARATELAQVHGKNVVFYVATDMFNDGWRGGDPMPPRVQAAVLEARAKLEGSLLGMVRFDAEKSGIVQDAMGIAGIVDAEVAMQAEEFVYGHPSSFGRWIEFVRLARDRKSVRVQCGAQKVTEEMVVDMRKELQEREAKQKTKARR